MGKFKKKIQEQAANKKSEDIAKSNKLRSSNVLQMEKNEDKPRKIHTDKELAKMARVVIGTLAYNTKEEVMGWMLDIQLGRRNLSPIQRIAIAEKYRPIYEKQAKENSLNNLKQNQNTEKSDLTIRKENNSTVDKLSSIAGVKPTTYKMGAKVLNSNNEEDKILKDLIETNIRQRGIGNPNPIKLSRCIKELERIYGIREGSAGNSHTNYFNGSNDPKTEKDLADMIGISVDTLQNYKKLMQI